MSEKSHVTLEQHRCVVCGVPYDTGNLLLDTRLRARFDRHTITEWGMCGEHLKKMEDGYVALIECDPLRTKRTNDRVAKPENAFRTGNIMHIKKEAFARLFDLPVPEKMVAFVEPDVVHQIEQIAKNSGL